MVQKSPRANRQKKKVKEKIPASSAKNSSGPITRNTGTNVQYVTGDQYDSAVVLTRLCLGMNPSIDPFVVCDLLVDAFASGLNGEEAEALGQAIRRTGYSPTSDPNDQTTH